MSGWPVEVDAWFGCHLWRGPLNSNGYPTYFGGGQPRQAYLVALERAGVVVPPGKAVDHACRRRTCVAVAHLEVVSQAENTRRIHWAYRSKLKACARGHVLDVHGRRTPQGGLVCRLCSGTWCPTDTEVLE